jgi:hypothetical protein
MLVRQRGQGNDESDGGGREFIKHQASNIQAPEKLQAPTSSWNLRAWSFSTVIQRIQLIAQLRGYNRRIGRRLRGIKGWHNLDAGC